MTSTLSEQIVINGVFLKYGYILLERPFGNLSLHGCHLHLRTWLNTKTRTDSAVACVVIQLFQFNPCFEPIIFLIFPQQTLDSLACSRTGDLTPAVDDRDAPAGGS